MLLRSRNIIRLLCSNHNQQTLFYFGKISQQIPSVASTVNPTNDRIMKKATDLTPAMQFVKRQLNELRQFLQANSKKQPGLINDKEINPVIKNLQKHISTMNYSEMIITLQMITDFNKYYHQFKKQYLSDFFKMLQLRIKQIIFKGQPLSHEQIANLFGLFVKFQSSIIVSKQILVYASNQLILNEQSQQFSQEGINFFRTILKILIYDVNKSKMKNKEYIVDIIDRFYYQQKLPVMSEVIWIMHEYAINFSQLPYWYFHYLDQVYHKVLKENNIFEHLTLLKNMVELRKYDKIAWDGITKHNSYLLKVCRIYQNMLKILDSKIPNQLQEDELIYFFQTLHDFVKHKETYIRQINKALKALKNQQKQLNLGLLITKIADKHIGMMKKTLYCNNKARKFIYSYMLCFQYTLQPIFNVNSEKILSLYKFLLEFIKKYIEDKANLIEYIRIIEFIVHIRKYLRPVDLKEFIEILHYIQADICKKLRKRQFYSFQVLRLRIIFKIMQIELKPQNPILKYYLTQKKQNSVKIFENLSRTLLVEDNLSEIVQICRDTMAKKSVQGISVDQVDTETWYIIISSIRTQEMILFWRPYIKKMAKSNKFIGYNNSVLSDERFNMLPQHLQLFADILLQCRYRDCYFRNTIDKFLRFSHTSKILQQLWIHSVHNIKHIFITNHILEIHNRLKDEKVSLYDAVSKLTLFLNNLISLPNNFLYQREIGFVLTGLLKHISQNIKSGLQPFKDKQQRIQSLIRDNLLWMKSNNVIEILYAELHNYPLVFQNFKFILKHLFKNSLTNTFDYIAIKQLNERFNNNDFDVNPFNIIEYQKIKKLMTEQLSCNQLKQYSIDEILSCLVRKINSVNYLQMYQKLARFIEQDKQLYLSVEAIENIIKQVISKKTLDFKIQQVKLMKAIITYLSTHYDLEYLPFSSLYAILQLHFQTKMPLPSNFPYINLIKENKFTLLQVAHYFNYFRLKVTPEDTAQLTKYLIYSRFFQYYFSIINKQILEPGSKKVGSVFRLMFINAKTDNFIKYVEIIVKQIKKVPKELLSLLSKQLALDICTARSLENIETKNILQILWQCLNQEIIKQTIKTKLQALSQYQKQTQGLLKENLLVLTEKKIQLESTSHTISLFENNNKQLVIVRKANDIWEKNMPNDQDYLLSLLITYKLDRKILFISI